MATQYQSLNNTDLAKVIRDTDELLAVVTTGPEEAPKKAFVRFGLDDLKAYFLEELRAQLGLEEADRAIPLETLGNDSVPKVATALTDEMCFTLRSTPTNPSRYWNAAPLVASLATVGDLVSLSRTHAAALDALNGRADVADSHARATEVRVDELAHAITQPHRLFSKEARAHLAENYLNRNDLMPYRSVVLGQRAGDYCGNLGASVLVGAGAGVGTLNAFKDFVAVGAYAQPLASRAVVLGNTSTQTFAAQSVATRADKRDFTNLKPLGLGLDFVLKLKPQVASMDLREDYITYGDMPYPPAPPGPEPSVAMNASAEAMAAYRKARLEWSQQQTAYLQGMADWRPKYAEWKQTNNVSTLVPDGTHRHTRTQTVLLADDLIAAAQSLNSIFTGVEDSKRNGGMDVKSLRVEEMVPVLVKAIQEIHALVTGDALVEAVAARLFEKNQAARASLRNKS